MAYRTNIYLVGAGPGDPELLTVKAFRILQRADVILYDSLVGDKILELANPDAELIDVGKRCGRHSMTQREISNLLVQKALSERVVVRLKGGDPMMFGRATEEMDALEGCGLDFEVVPGITAAIAAAARLKLSLTHRQLSRAVHFVTGHAAEGGVPPHDFVALTKAGGTLVIYMGGQTIGGFAAHLIEAGADPALPAVAIENVSMPAEEITHGTLSSLPKLLVESPQRGPVLIMAGEALRFLDGIRTAEERSVQLKTVVEFVT
jgi:uroporphyrin-III C-methyltransferase